MSTEKRISVGARLDRLPVAKWHYKMLVLIGLGLFVDGVDNYMGSAVLSQLIESGWSNNYLNATFISFTMLGLLCPRGATNLQSHAKAGGKT